MDFSVYLLIGIAAGVLSGSLGIGGGIVVVPALLIWFKHIHLFSNDVSMHFATGTSLAAMIGTASAAALVYHQRKFTVWPLFFRFFPGLCLGMLLGAVLGNYITSTLLSRIFGIFLLLVMLHMLLPRQKAHLESHQSLKLFFIVCMSIFIGVLSTLLGVGGGLLIVPFFLYLNFSMNEAAGSSVLCGIPISILGTLMLTCSGWTYTHDSSAPWGAIGYVYWPAAIMISITSTLCANISARYATGISPLTRKLILSAILIICSFNMLILK